MCSRTIVVRPTENPYNNYSTRGNVNPYTGKTGTKDPLPSTPYRAR
jgi:hypothetical protein